MVRKQVPVALLAVLAQLALEKSASEVTHNQWLKRQTKIFLLVRKEQCVIFSAPQCFLKDKSLSNVSSIRILAVGVPNWTGSMSVGPVVT